MVLYTVYFKQVSEMITTVEIFFPDHELAIQNTIHDKPVDYAINRIKVSIKSGKGLNTKMLCSHLRYIKFRLFGKYKKMA